MLTSTSPTTMRQHDHTTGATSLNGSSRSNVSAAAEVAAFDLQQVRTPRVSVQAALPSLVPTVRRVVCTGDRHFPQSDRPQPSSYPCTVDRVCHALCRQISTMQPFTWSWCSIRGVLYGRTVPFVVHQNTRESFSSAYLRSLGRPPYPLTSSPPPPPPLPPMNDPVLPTPPRSPAATTTPGQGETASQTSKKG
jgi:hypothetical protein